MSGFTDPLVVSPMADWRNWVLQEPFGYIPQDPDLGGPAKAPIGFVTDFATVPPPLRWLLPQFGSYGYATVIHDWLYWHQDRTRDQADRLFLAAMRELKVRGLLRWIMYLGVVVFGGTAWNRNQWDSKAEFDRVIPCDSLEPTTRMRRPSFLKRAWTHAVEK